MISPQQFWDRLVASGLLPGSKVARLRAKIDSKPSIAGSAIEIARALVANEILTQEQARSFLSAETAATAVPSPEIPQIQDLPEADPRSIVRQEKSKRPWFVGLGGVLLVAVSAFFLFRSATDEPSGGNSGPALTAHPAIPGEADNSPYQLTDSKEALWARPKPGQPFEIRYLPPGTQMIVRIQMAQLTSQPSGRMIVRSVGPHLEEQLRVWTTKMGIDAKDLDELMLFLLPQGTTDPLLIAQGKIQGANASERFASLGEFDERHVMKLATNAIWCPAESPAHFYYGPWNIVKDLPTLESGLLRRELQQLHLETHDTDVISILANPNFLRDEAQGLFPNTRRRLLDGLLAFWSDEAQAVSLGFQQHDSAFLEVRMIALEDLQPRRLAAQVRAFLKRLPTEVSDFLGRARLDPHWQPLAMRFPAMVSFVVNETRVVVEGKQVAMTAVGPVEATHNLLLASELSLATPIRAGASQIVDDTRITLDELLTSRTSVRFAQKSLEEALQDIAEQIREERHDLQFQFEIRIVGSDLEPEGITRNQQIRDFNAADLPLAEVLTALMMKANPVQSVAGPNDPAQKLVWVKSAERRGLIQITTRSAAASKNLQLPESFR